MFGFDAGIISGVMNYAGPQFNLSDGQIGWVTSAPSFAAMISMLFAGRMSDRWGRKPLLIIVAILYTVSALWSAYAQTYESLYIARMVGGLAFGAALILAPIYIAEISTSANRGKLVAIQQLNIVFGFFAAFLSNYHFNESLTAGIYDIENVWRWMLGVEMIPAALYFIALLAVPRSPRWLFLNSYKEKAVQTLNKIHTKEVAVSQITLIEESHISREDKEQIPISYLFKKSIRFILVIGLVVGILQQVTGINAIYFYATSIFKQTGIGTDAAFASSVLLAAVTVVFTIISMFLIDRVGRRPLLLVGTAGIAVSLMLCAYAFNIATYSLSKDDIQGLQFEESTMLIPVVDRVFKSDVEFKNEMKSILGTQSYNRNDGDIIEAATTMDANLVLIGILGFIACFAFSLGPVMWVLLSELYPMKIRALAVGCIAFVNSACSSIVQLIFPWELSNLGNALTFLIFGVIAAVGFFILFKILPETKGKSLEQLELELVETH